MTQNAAIVGSQWLIALKLLTTMHLRHRRVGGFAMERDGDIFLNKKMVMKVCINHRKS